MFTVIPLPIMLFPELSLSEFSKFPAFSLAELSEFPGFSFALGFFWVVFSPADWSVFAASSGGEKISVNLSQPQDF